MKLCESSEEGVIDCSKDNTCNGGWHMYFSAHGFTERSMCSTCILFCVVHLIPPGSDSFFYCSLKTSMQDHFLLIVESHDCNPGNTLESFGKAVSTLDILNILGSLPDRGNESPSETVWVYHENRTGDIHLMPQIVCPESRGKSSAKGFWKNTHPAPPRKN